MPAMLQVADYQADPSADKRVVDGDADAVLSGDSDFAMCLGSSSDYFDMMTKDASIDKKNATIQTAKIATSQQKVAAWTEPSLTNRMECELVFPRTWRKGKKGTDLETFDHTPKRPCLSEVKDIRTRAMLVLIAGCDVLTSGLKKGVGSKLCCETSRSVSGATIDENRNSCMSMIVSKKKPKSVPENEWKAAIKCLVNSIVCEPTRNGCIFDNVPDELEKCNEGCEIYEGTTTIDRPKQSVAMD